MASHHYVYRRPAPHVALRPVGIRGIHTLPVVYMVPVASTGDWENRASAMAHLKPYVIQGIYPTSIDVAERLHSVNTYAGIEPDDPVVVVIPPVVERKGGGGGGSGSWWPAGREDIEKREQIAKDMLDLYYGVHEAALENEELADQAADLVSEVAETSSLDLPRPEEVDFLAFLDEGRTKTLEVLTRLRELQETAGKLTASRYSEARDEEDAVALLLLW